MNTTPSDIMKNRLLFQEKSFTTADFFDWEDKKLWDFLIHGTENPRNASGVSLSDKGLLHLSPTHNFKCQNPNVK